VGDLDPFGSRDPRLKIFQCLELGAGRGGLGEASPTQFSQGLEFFRLIFPMPRTFMAFRVFRGQHFCRALTVLKWTEGKPIRKVIVVPGRLVNIAVS